MGQVEKAYGIRNCKFKEATKKIGDWKLKYLVKIGRNRRDESPSVRKI